MKYKIILVFFCTPLFSAESSGATLYKRVCGALSSAARTVKMHSDCYTLRRDIAKIKDLQTLFNFLRASDEADTYKAHARRAVETQIPTIIDDSSKFICDVRIYGGGAAYDNMQFCEYLLKLSHRLAMRGMLDGLDDRVINPLQDCFDFNRDHAIRQIRDRSEPEVIRALGTIFVATWNKPMRGLMDRMNSQVPKFHMLQQVILVKDVALLCMAYDAEEYEQDKCELVSSRKKLRKDNDHNVGKLSELQFHGAATHVAQLYGGLDGDIACHLAQFHNGAK